MNQVIHFLEDGTYVDALVGYRCWLPWPDKGVVYLKSIATKNSTWPVGPLEAKCSAGYLAARVLGTSSDFAHTAPKSKCECGIWSFTEFDRLLTTYPSPHYLRGEIRMWGTIKKHDYGYRAQFAQVYCIYEPETENEDDPILHFMKFKARLAAHHYNVPLVKSPVPNVGRGKISRQEEQILRGLAMRPVRPLQ